jgi:hypothetical protein
MMTPAQIAADVSEIRSRDCRDDALDALPVTTKWSPTPPFVAKANPHASRGHAEERGNCITCEAVKPRGGWTFACPAGDAREFKGAG